LCLLGRCWTTWATSPALLSLAILGIGSCILPWPTWTTVLLFMLHTFVWMTNTCHHTSFFSTEMESYKLVFAGLAWNCHPPDLSLLCSLEWQVRTTGTCLFFTFLL
jgi:hypothetical protein